MRGSVALLLLIPSVALAQPKTPPVILELTGDQPVGVYVTAGFTVPCDSDNNKPLFKGVLKPGAPIAVDTESGCVCIQQTFAPFTTTGWSASNLACRPRRCWGKICRPDLTKPIRIYVRSKE